jgi:hypothetical protein
MIKEDWTVPEFTKDELKPKTAEILGQIRGQDVEVQLMVDQDAIYLLIDGWYVFHIDTFTGKGFLVPDVGEGTQLALDGRNRIKLSNE